MIGDRVAEALDAVIDPCSAAQGTPLGLDEMGLVREVELCRTGEGDGEGVNVRIVLAMTSPCCEYGPRLARAAAESVRALPGISTVRVELDHAAMWTPADLTPAAHQVLVRSRARTIEQSGIRPYDWRHWEESA